MNKSLQSPISPVQVSHLLYLYYIFLYFFLISQKGRSKLKPKSPHARKLIYRNPNN